MGLIENMAKKGGRAGVKLPAPTTAGDDQVIAAKTGEYVLPPEVVAMIGIDKLDAMVKQMTGQQPGGQPAEMPGGGMPMMDDGTPMQGHAGGGLIGMVSKFDGVQLNADPLQDNRESLSRYGFSGGMGSDSVATEISRAAKGMPAADEVMDAGMDRMAQKQNALAPQAIGQRKKLDLNGILNLERLGGLGPDSNILGYSGGGLISRMQGYANGGAIDPDEIKMGDKYRAANRDLIAGFSAAQPAGASQAAKLAYAGQQGLSQRIPPASAAPAPNDTEFARNGGGQPAVPMGGAGPATFDQFSRNGAPATFERAGAGVTPSPAAGFNAGRTTFARADTTPATFERVAQSAPPAQQSAQKGFGAFDVGNSGQRSLVGQALDRTANQMRYGDAAPQPDPATLQPAQRMGIASPNGQQAPQMTDQERQSEIARRRAALEPQAKAPSMEQALGKFLATERAAPTQAIAAAPQRIPRTGAAKTGKPLVQAAQPPAEPAIDPAVMADAQAAQAELSQSPIARIVGGTGGTMTIQYKDGTTKQVGQEGMDEVNGFYGLTSRAAKQYDAQPVEIIAGHNRTMAMPELGYQEVPAEVARGGLISEYTQGRAQGAIDRSNPLAAEARNRLSEIEAQRQARLSEIGAQGAIGAPGRALQQRAGQFDLDQKKQLAEIQRRALAGDQQAIQQWNLLRGGEKGGSDVEKARYGLIGELSKAYASSTPFDPETKQAIPFDQWAEPMLRSASGAVKSNSGPSYEQYAAQIRAKNPGASVTDAQLQAAYKKQFQQGQ